MNGSAESWPNYCHVGATLSLVGLLRAETTDSGVIGLISAGFVTDTSDSMRSNVTRDG
jgi:hypothetical protein